MGKIVDFDKVVLSKIEIAPKGDGYVFRVFFFRESTQDGSNLGVESVELVHPGAKGVWEAAKAKVEAL